MSRAVARITAPRTTTPRIIVRGITVRGIIVPGIIVPGIALLSALAPAQVSPDLVKAIKNEGLNNSHAMKFLDHLTNSIGYRLTGSDNFTAACEWTRGEFQKMGPKARLEKWDEWQIVWNRRQWAGRVLEPALFLADPASFLTHSLTDPLNNPTPVC